MKNFIAKLISFISKLFKVAARVSDGYHTFEELYSHRNELFVLILSFVKDSAWKSKYDSDGTHFDGWFVAGIFKDSGEQITYHLPIRYWHKLSFITTLDKAPTFDGHTSDDVLNRLDSFSRKVLYVDNSEKLLLKSSSVLTGTTCPISEDKSARAALDGIIQLLRAGRKSPERSISIRKIQEGIMWLGMDLKALNEENPYPESYNPDSKVIEPTADGLKM